MFLDNGYIQILPDYQGLVNIEEEDLDFVEINGVMYVVNSEGEIIGILKEVKEEW